GVRFWPRNEAHAACSPLPAKERGCEKVGMLTMRNGTMMHRLLVTALGSLLLGSSSIAAPAPAAPDLLGVSSCLINPKRIVQLGSPVAGLLSDVLVDRGATVTAGQLVAKLESSVEEAQVEVDRFRATNTAQIEAGKVDLEFNQKELAIKERLRENM